MAKKKSIQQTYRNDEVEVQVTEDEQAYFYAMKDGEEVGYCLTIQVVDLKTKDCLNEYFIQLPVGANMGAYHQFIKKFLTQPKFREEYRNDDKEKGWEGVISLEVDDKGVDQRCERQIQRLNGSKNLHFKDFMNLKTFGRDKVSSMKREKLVEELSSSDVSLVEQELDGEKQQVAALRWIYRGLNPKLAIRKVLTDLEIANNMR